MRIVFFTESMLPLVDGVSLTVNEVTDDTCHRKRKSKTTWNWNE